MPEIHPLAVLHMLDMQKAAKVREYEHDLDDDAETDAGPVLRFHAALFMQTGIQDRHGVWAQVEPALHGPPLARVARAVLELTDSAMALGGTIEQETPERYVLSWPEEPAESF